MSAHFGGVPSIICGSRRRPPPPGMRALNHTFPQTNKISPLNMPPNLDKPRTYPPFPLMSADKPVHPVQLSAEIPGDVFGALQTKVAHCITEADLRKCEAVLRKCDVPREELFMPEDELSTG